MMSATKDEITFIIPTLNEEGAIGKVIDEIRLAGFQKLIVVDGKSTDRTRQVARERGVKVVVQPTKGKTEAVKTGIAAADTEFVALIDGDGSYDPSDVEKMLAAAGTYDQIIGQRCLERVPPARRFGNRLVSLLVSTFLRMPLDDVCSGLYLLRREKARELPLAMNGFSTEVEIAFGMANKGVISQVPISYRERIGRSKLSLWRHGPQIVLSVFNLAWNKKRQESLN